MLANRIVPELERPQEPKLGHDSSTNALVGATAASGPEDRGATAGRPLAQLRLGGGTASAAPDRQRAGRRARASNAIRSVAESAAVPLA